MSELFNQNDIQRWRELDTFMKAYLASTDRVALYRQYESLLKSVKPIDLFHVGLYQDDTTATLEEIKLNAGRFVNLFFHGLSTISWNKKASPMLEFFIHENEAILERLENIKPFLDANSIEKSQEILIGFFQSMDQIALKFIKMQNILYPELEKILPSRTPFKVLWSIEDELLELRQTVLSLLMVARPDWQSLKITIGQFYYQLSALIQKEDLIIFPLASEHLSLNIWNGMTDAAFEIGFAYLTLKKPVVSTQNLLQGKIISTQSGSLTFEQFDLIMGHLPVAITYVDEFDKVCYYNQTKTRHFPRTPQVIGREVKFCHPAKSVHIVERIISEFRNGKKDEAMFWMTFKELKLLITYYAVRDAIGHYKGVLEVTQDITLMKDLQGEKRLLDWE